MVDIVWTEDLPGEYETEVDGVTYGVHFTDVGWWVWTSSAVLLPDPGPGPIEFEFGLFGSADDAKKNCEASIAA